MLEYSDKSRPESIATAVAAARSVALGLLGSLKGVLGDLDRITRVVKLLCMVNSEPGFGDQPRVANGATDLLGKLYGERGNHARSSVGLEKGGGPQSASVEIEMIVEVSD